MFRENCVRGVRFLTADAISARHGFSTRIGGVSAGVYESLNLRVHSDDEPDRVRENYRRLFGALGMPEAAVFSHQVHGKIVRAVTAADIHTLFTPVPYDADGLITDTPGLPLIIFTADCVPILLHDPVRGAAGAVHAGWRGTALDIVGEAVHRMTACFGSRPADIRAAIGPSIGPCCFETGPEVPAAMRAALGPAAETCIARRGEKDTVDLKRMNRLLLERAGLRPEHIDVSGACTACRHELYWSHRWTGGRRGAQGALIML